MGLPNKAGLELHARWPAGRRNMITDVKGVRVGHVTIHEGDVHSGVTAILPQGGNLFKNKVMAGVSILNGFGKSLGLMQVRELGTLETPIILTNTLAVGTAFEAVVRYKLRRNSGIGGASGTVNPIVMECNDGTLSDIRSLPIREAHVLRAIEAASVRFEEGAVGGGTGMSCLGLKGGIGSASKVVAMPGGAEGEGAAPKAFTIGALAMTNFGAPGNLIIGGKHYDTRKCYGGEGTKAEAAKVGAISADAAPDGAISKTSASAAKGDDAKDKGSVIMIIATDAPLSERQLERLANRSAIALGRVGSYMGNGSGDIALAFSTANRVPHDSKERIINVKRYHDGELDELFEAAVEAVEEALVSSLYHAETLVGFRGKKKWGLREYLEKFEGRG